MPVRNRRPMPPILADIEPISRPASPSIPIQVRSDYGTIQPSVTLFPTSLHRPNSPELVEGGCWCSLI